MVENDFSDRAKADMARVNQVSPENSKTSEELIAELIAEMEPLEKLRKRTLKKQNYGLLAGMLMSIPAMFMVSGVLGDGLWILTGAVGMVVSAAVLFYSAYFVVRDFNVRYKMEVVQKLLTTRLENVRFEPYGNPEIARIFSQSGITQEYYERLTVTDAINGYYQGREVRIAEIRTEIAQRQENTNSRLPIIRFQEVFRGIFVVAGPKQTVGSLIFVKTGQSKHKLLNAFDRMNKGDYLKDFFSGLKRAEIPDEEFNSVFYVMTSDEAAANRLLDYETRHRMVELRNRFVRGVEFAYTPASFALSIKTDFDLFDTSLQRSLLEAKVLRRAIDQLDELLALIDTIGSRSDAPV